MGQGLHTKIAQIAASAFNIPLTSVFVSETSTDKVIGDVLLKVLHLLQLFTPDHVQQKIIIGITGETWHGCILLSKVLEKMNKMEVL